MIDRITQEEVDELLEEYDRSKRSYIMDSLNADKTYVENGKRVARPEDIPDGEFYEGASREDIKEFREVYKMLSACNREKPLNEEVIFDQIATGSLTFWAPWNLGMSQKLRDMAEQVEVLEEYADIIESNSDLDAQIKVYGLDPYARNNGRNPAPLKNDLRELIKPMENVEYIDWNRFRNNVLDGNWSKEVNSARKEVEDLPEGTKDSLRNNPSPGSWRKYAAMRIAESKMMGGKMRLSPGKREDDTSFVATSGESGLTPKQLEGVFYGPFMGPWKSFYSLEKNQLSVLLDNMRQSSQ